MSQKSRKPKDKKKYKAVPPPLEDLVQIRSLIENDPDYIYSHKYNYSLKELEKERPNGVSDKFIANVLLLSIQDIKIIYENIIKKTRQILKIELSSDYESKNN